MQTVEKLQTWRMCSSEIGFDKGVSNLTKYMYSMLSTLYFVCNSVVNFYKDACGH